MCAAQIMLSEEFAARSLHVDGRTVRYRSKGSGPTIMLLSGFTRELDGWDAASIEQLVAHGFRVQTVLSGVLGANRCVEGFSPFPLVTDAYVLAEALDLRDFVIGCWSLGGLAAQLFATQFVSRISHVLVLGNIPCRVTSTSAAIASERVKERAYTIDQISASHPSACRQPMLDPSSVTGHCGETDALTLLPKIGHANITPRSLPPFADAALQSKYSVESFRLEVGNTGGLDFTIGACQPLWNVLPTLQLPDFPISRPRDALHARLGKPNGPIRERGRCR
jgi:pimeloyl-ACP methyl ester carboxylesterase